MFQLANSRFQKLGRSLRQGCLLGMLVWFFLPSVAQARVYVGLDQEGYFARKEFLYGEEQYTNLNIRLKGTTDSNTWFTGIDVGGMTSLTVKDYRGFFLSEAY